MKTNYLFLLFAAGCLWFQSCDKDNDNPNPGNERVQQTFHSLYPGAERIDWERSGSYYVADFRYQNNDRSAWFDANGTWLMTETDYTLVRLPEAVRSALLTGDYANWQIEEIDLYERPDTEDIYVIEVEQGGQELDLIYASDGTLLKALTHTDDDPGHFLPQSVPTEVQTFISSQYPGAQIVDTDQEVGHYEVDIRHENFFKEVYFNASWEWTMTQWEVRPSALPNAVLQTVAQNAGSSYVIDDADYVVTPTGSWYLIEIDRPMGDIKLKITAEGQLIS